MTKNPGISARVSFFRPLVIYLSAFASRLLYRAAALR